MAGIHPRYCLSTSGNSIEHLNCLYALLRISNSDIQINHQVKFMQNFFKNWNWFHVVVEYEWLKLRTFLGSYNSFIKQSVCMVEWNCRLNRKDSFWFVTNFLTSRQPERCWVARFSFHFFKNKTPWWGRWK